MSDFLYIQAEGVVKTSPPMSGKTTVVARGRRHELWRERRRIGGSKLYLVKVHNYEADVLWTGGMSMRAEAEKALVAIDEGFCPSTAATALDKIFNRGGAELLARFTSKQFASAIVTLVVREGLPVDVAIEVAIAIGLEAEKCG